MTDDYVAPVVAKALPVIKWAGGKRQLIPEIIKFIPPKITSYFEPFMGGGALFFHLANENRFEQATVNDVNPEIANLYQVIQRVPEDLMKSLDYMAELGFSREVYNEVRAIDTQDLDPHERAARTIYLNKCGFNGLYRQNKKGQFNVPWGKRTNPTLYDRDVILACSEALQDTTICSGDFTCATPHAGPGSVVYMDPPYVPHSETSNFKNYTADGFTMEDQIRVRDLFAQLANQGVLVIASNNDTPVVRELYAGFEVHGIQARRNINSKGAKRGPVGEILVVANA